MKKVLFAALVACAAVVSTSAAEFQWGFSSDSCMMPDGSDYLSGGTALLYLGTVTYADGTGFDTSAATLITTGGQTADYTFGHQSESSMPTAAAVNGSGGQAYTLILVDQSGVASIDDYVGSYYMSTGTSGSGYYMDGTDPVFYAKMIDDTAVSAWSTAAAPTPPTPPPGTVPEPTSGLLMLVGLGALALRRKR